MKCKLCGKEIEKSEFESFFESWEPSVCSDECGKVLRDKKIKENYEKNKTFRASVTIRWSLAAITRLSEYKKCLKLGASYPKGWGWQVRIKGRRYSTTATKRTAHTEKNNKNPTARTGEVCMMRIKEREHWTRRDIR